MTAEEKAKERYNPAGSLESAIAKVQIMAFVQGYNFAKEWIPVSRENLPKETCTVFFITQMKHMHWGEFFYESGGGFFKHWGDVYNIEEVNMYYPMDLSFLKK